jgi:predicted Zn-dependent protease
MQTMPGVKNSKLLRGAALALLVAAVSLASVAQEQRIVLPDMGNSADNFLSDSEEAEYARAMLMQMRAYGMLVNDPLISGYFADMGFRLVANSDRPEKPFTFVVLDEPRVNAFAAPGGVVALHSGLIMAAESESEVAGVLAHEIAHVTQLHLYRTLENAQNMTIPIALGMLAIMVAGGGSGQAIAGALASGQAMSVQSYINFTRDNEYEADRIGMTTLSLSGYDPEGMAMFFERLNRLNRAAGEGPPEFLRTHPVTVNRIAEAKNRAAALPKPEQSDGLDFFLAQARLRALLDEQPGDTLEWFKTRLAKPGEEAQTRALQYGLAISLQRLREFDEARSWLDRLLASEPHKLAYLLQMASLDLESGHEQRALETLRDLHVAFAGNHAIAVHYAEALLRERDPERAAIASETLRQQLLTRREDPQLYELYARASSFAGHDIRAAEALSEAYLLNGRMEDAIQQLEMLSGRDDLDYYQRARVSARLEEMRIIAKQFEQPEQTG